MSYKPDRSAFGHNQLSFFSLSFSTVDKSSTNSSFFLLDSFDSINPEKNIPSSYSIQIGIAYKVCEMISGGVNNIPIVNAPTITYGLFLINRDLDVALV